MKILLQYDWSINREIETLGTLHYLLRPYRYFPNPHDNIKNKIFYQDGNQKPYNCQQLWVTPS